MSASYAPKPSGADNGSDRSRPVGIFDSGIGGLTVLKALHETLPAEDAVYFGDTAHLPYGTKSKETITRFSIDNTQFLSGFDVKMVIVACNTASALSLDVLRERSEVPVIGVIEPGAREAVRRTKNGRIGIIGTRATIGSGSYEACVKRLDPAAKVYSQACPLFVPLVEEGWLEGEVTEKVARLYLDSLKGFKIDTLILGCTHYPLLEKVIRKILGTKVNLVNSAVETARETQALLKRKGLLSTTVRRAGQTRFYVSDEPEPFRTLGERFLGCPIASVAKVGSDLAPEAQAARRRKGEGARRV